MKNKIIVIFLLCFTFVAINPTFGQFEGFKQKAKNLLKKVDKSIKTKSTKTTKQDKSIPKEAKSSTTNIYDQKLDKLEAALNNWVPWAEKNRNGENVYQQLNDATVKYANLNEEISADIENGKLSKKQYNRYLKIYDRYMDYVHKGY